MGLERKRTAMYWVLKMDMMLYQQYLIYFRYLYLWLQKRISLFPFYRWRNWNIKRLYDLPKITELASRWDLNSKIHVLATRKLEERPPTEYSLYAISCVKCVVTFPENQAKLYIWAAPWQMNTISSDGEEWVEHTRQRTTWIKSTTSGVYRWRSGVRNRGTWSEVEDGRRWTRKTKITLGCLP